MGASQTTAVSEQYSDSDTEHGTEKEVRMVLVGKTGAGKSETGNHILLQTKKEENPFNVEPFGESVTKHCSCSVNHVFDHKLVLVDTPGLFDTKKKNLDTLKELSRFMLLLQPGPHAIILVIRIGRQTNEIQQTVDLLLKLFKKDAYSYMIVLFTGKDDLLYDNVSLDSYIKTARPEIQDIISRCSNRCIAFNNCANEDENEKQVKELLEMMRSMVKQNGGKCFVSDLQKELNQLVTCEDLEHPDCFRDKVLNENATSSASWMWEALVAVAATFGWDL